MSNPVKPIPDGRQSAAPYLIVRDAAAALDFYQTALGAVETMRLKGPDGRIGHAEFTIGAARFMLAGESPAMGAVSPATLGGSPVMICLYVEDVDSFVARAVAAGLKVKRPVQDQFYGDRAGSFEDPFGHSWWFASRVEDVSNEEIQRRSAKMFGSA